MGRMWRLLLCVMVTASLLSAALPHPHFIQERSGSGRSSRGFQVQNGKLSTARGFGKRGGGTRLESGGMGGLSDFLNYPPPLERKASVPYAWLEEERGRSEAENAELQQLDPVDETLPINF